MYIYREANKGAAGGLEVCCETRMMRDHGGAEGMRKVGGARVMADPRGAEGVQGQDRAQGLKG